MQRVLRWLWRQCCKVALVGLFLIGGALVAAAPPARSVTEAPAQLRLVRPGMAALAAAGNRPAPQERERARERARRGRLLYLGSLLYEGVLVFGFLALGGTRWLARLAARFGGRWAAAVAVVAAVIGLAGALLTFPLDYYSGFVFQHQYGLSNQTPLQWLRDYLLNEGVSAAVGLPLIVLAYAILRKTPRHWWVWLTAASVPISVVMMLLVPVFLLPLFNTFTPIRDETLRREILAMAHARGIAARDIYEIDASRQSNATNACVIGFGPTLRIVLYDTLIKNFSHEEIEYVMAHEMGHYTLGHIYQGMLFSILGTLVGSYLLYRTLRLVLRRFGAALGITALGDPASYPLLIAMGLVLSVVATPIGNAFSRHLEWQADRYAAQTFPHWDAGIAAFQKLASTNVAEEDPPRWAVALLYTHPSLQQRIQALEALKAGSPNPWPLPRKE